MKPQSYQKPQKINQSQQGNEPTGQETNKPTNPQGNTPTPQQATRAEMNPQTNQKTTKNQPKINQNGSKIGLGGCFGRFLGLLGRLGPILAPRWPQEPKKWKFVNSSYASWGASWEPKSIQNRSGGLPKSDHFFDCLWGRVLLPLGPNLAPTWPPKPSPNPAKLAPRSIKKWIKMPTHFLFDF